jgi:hypothetical protein
MEKYLGVKLVEAEPKERYKDVDYENCLLKNKQEGYKVVYPDGYESWSPKEIFEEAYRRIDNLTFGLAIEAMKKGYKVARKGWNGKEMWIVLMPSLYLPPYNTADTYRKVNDRTAKHIGEDKPLDSQPYIAMWTAQGKWQPGWLASQADILAEDWMVVE